MASGNLFLLVCDSILLFVMESCHLRVTEKDRGDDEKMIIVVGCLDVFVRLPMVDNGTGGITKETSSNHSATFFVPTKKRCF